MEGARVGERIEAAVLVVGAGPVGATLAVTLAAAGVPVVSLDRAPLPPMELPAFDGRAYAIARTSRNLLEAAGIWDALPAPAGPIRAIRVADGRPGERASPLSLHFDAGEVGEEAFGWMVEARSLRVALNRRLAALPSATVIAPMTAEVTRRAEGVEARLADGRIVRARLAVGAEGRNSGLRDAAGIGVARLDYRQVGIVGSVAHERPHGGVALEAFLPNGPFAQLPLAELATVGGAAGPDVTRPDVTRPDMTRLGAAGSAASAGAGPGGATPTDDRLRAAADGLPHASAFVWSERTALARRFLAMDDAALAREIGRRMGDHLGRVRVIGRRWSYPLSALQAMRFTDTRLALVGDAAHGIHPIAGQGLNVGFRDVAVLAERVVEAFNAGADVGGAAVLAAYQADRRPDSLLMLGATHALERLFGNDLGPVRLARRIGIAAVDRMPGVKGWFARRAMGFGGAGSGLLEGRGLLLAG